MNNEQERIEEMAKVMQKDFCDGFADNRGCCFSRSSNNNCIDCKKVFADETNEYAEKLITAGYRKASEVIGEFVEKINLVECEMFHKAHDIRNASEEKLDRCNWKDVLQWGEYKKQEGKMIALQDFMTKIKRIAAEYGVEVEE